MLLAIDTSTGTSVAVVDGDGTVRAVAAEPDARRHAEAIGTLIDAVLRQSHTTPSAITAVAAGMGPGPFTGLRVGIAAARAFAFGVGVAVIPVASHDAVAFGHPGPVVVVTDARRRELAWSAYAAAHPDGLPRRIAGPALVPAAEIGTVLDAYPHAARIDVSLVDAGALGALAARSLALGVPPEPPQPLYLRPPDVTVVPG